MSSGQYVLSDGQPVPCNDLMEWGRWMQKADRKVQHTVVDDVEVSTVFLGLDHCFGHGPPLLFETMIFGGAHNGYQERYATIEEARQGHLAAVQKVTP